MDTKLIYKELSYKLNGLAFEIDNKLGFGLREKTYCSALEEILKREKIEYTRELYAPIKIENKVIAKRYFDFLVNDQIVIEVKIADYNYKQTYTQLLEYLVSSKFKLGLIIRFTKSGVKIKRVPNFNL